MEEISVITKLLQAMTERKERLQCRIEFAEQVTFGHGIWVCLAGGVGAGPGFLKCGTGWPRRTLN